MLTYSARFSVQVALVADKGLIHNGTITFTDYAPGSRDNTTLTIQPAGSTTQTVRKTQLTKEAAYDWMLEVLAKVLVCGKRNLKIIGFKWTQGKGEATGVITDKSRAPWIF